MYKVIQTCTAENMTTILLFLYCIIQSAYGTDSTASLSYNKIASKCAVLIMQYLAFGHMYIDFIPSDCI